MGSYSKRVKFFKFDYPEFVAASSDPDNGYPAYSHYHFGSVFGGGYGSNDRNTTTLTYYGDELKSSGQKSEPVEIAGRVYGNATVNLTAGQVLENVYGGGDIASVGTPDYANSTTSLIAQKENTGACSVSVSGTTIVGPLDYTGQNANVYAAGKGVGNDPSNNYRYYCNVSNSTLAISGGHVWGNTFGGGADCHVLGDARTVISGTADIGYKGITEHDGCVFGGGRNFYNVNHSAGRVQGHTYVNMTGGNLKCTIFGGGSMARTGVDVNGEITSLLINGEYDSLHHGSTFIHVEGTTSTVDNKTVYSTIIGDPVGFYLVNCDYTIGDIFGGGKGDTRDSVDIQAGRVMNAHITTSGSPRIMGDIYGGGEMACVGWRGYEDKVTNTSQSYYPKTGYTYVTVSGTPYIGTEFEFSASENIYSGGNWSLVDANGKLFHTCSGNVYGGGQGFIWPTHKTWVNMGHVYETHVTINGGKMLGNIFGGGSRGIVMKDTWVKVTGGEIGCIIDEFTEPATETTPAIYHPSYYYGSVFGGGYGNPSLNNDPPNMARTFGSEHNDSTYYDPTTKSMVMCEPAGYAGRIYGNTNVEISGGKIMGHVYGGGDLASVGFIKSDGTLSTSTCNVTIKNTVADAAYHTLHPEVEVGTTVTPIIGPLEDALQNACVFGSGRGESPDANELYKKYCNSNNTNIIITGGRIWGSIYGGGADNHVLGNVAINVSGDVNIGKDGLSTYDGNIFGGGQNLANKNHTNGRVGGNISITMTGGAMQGTIFGGGRNALTGVDVSGNPIIVDANSDNINDNGNVTIAVSGTTTSIGNPNGHELLNLSDESVGDIFGSGKGDTWNYEDILAGRVANAKITVSGSPRIYGSVFGGGEMASIGYWSNSGDFLTGTGYSEVNILGGTIGTKLEFAKEYMMKQAVTIDDTLYIQDTANKWPGTWTVYDTLDDGTETTAATRLRLTHTCTGNVFGGAQGDVDTNCIHWVSMGRSKETKVVIGNSDGTGPTILGSVYGGAEQGVVVGNTDVLVQGGIIGTTDRKDNNGKTYCFGSVFGGGYGSTRFQINTDNKAPDKYEPNIPNDSSKTPMYIAGRVYGNTNVTIAGGKIASNVYGGGNQASVGYEYTDNTGKDVILHGACTVSVTGGQIGPDYAFASPIANHVVCGHVFGGCRGVVGKDFVNYSNSNTALVTIGDPDPNVATAPLIKGSVFGGGENGHLFDTTLVIVNKGTIGCTVYTGNDAYINDYAGNVYGGGLGIQADLGGNLMRTAGIVKNATHVKINGGHIYNNVYGGGSMATVGDGVSENSSDPYQLYKNYSKAGYLESSVGRCWVEVTGGRIGNYVAPTGNDADGWTKSPNALYSSVYGGGRGLSGHDLSGQNKYGYFGYVNNTVVEIKYSSCDANASGTNHIVGNVFGGGNNGHVKNSTRVIVTGGRIGSDGNKNFGDLEGNIFGGGDGTERYKAYLLVADKDDDNKLKYKHKTSGALQTDTTNATIVDSISRTAGLVYGNSYVQIGNADGSTAVDAIKIMHHVYGGGNLGSVGDYGLMLANNQAFNDNFKAADGRIKGEIYPLTNASGIGYHDNSPVATGNCEVYIYGGTLGSTGGNNGMVFGACRGDIGAPGDLLDSVAYVNNATVTIGRSTETPGYANPLIWGSVYGGGENGHTIGNTIVTIHDGMVGNHGSDYETVKTLKAKANPTDAEKTELATKQLFLSNCGNVYGGGCGTDTYKDVNDGNKEKNNPHAGVVYGNATVTIDGGYVEHNVYGSGAMSCLGLKVGEEKHTDETNQFALSWPIEIYYRTGTGIANVTVEKKARIGYNGDENGDVYGAARGKAGDYKVLGNYANAWKSNVTINTNMPTGYTEATATSFFSPRTNPMIAGSVYGGGENGHVSTDATVTITNGLIGGNVYGGGKGMGKYATTLKGFKAKAGGGWEDGGEYETDIYSHTAGKVYGNSIVTMSGGHVLNNIYGGGNMGSVGKGNYTGEPDGYYPQGYGETVLYKTKADAVAASCESCGCVEDTANSGRTVILITGGTVGTPTGTYSDENGDTFVAGNLFGGCRGLAVPTVPGSLSPRIMYRPEFFYAYSNRTKVVVGTKDAVTGPTIYGSVFGGGENGHVRFATDVTVNSGTIGNAKTDDNNLNDKQWTDRGCVFGAGSGYGRYDEDKDGTLDSYSQSSGSVTDYVNVTINGGTIHNSVYGGGNLGTVGPPKINPERNPRRDETLVRVNINSSVGTTTGIGYGYGGYVFGSSRGLASPDIVVNGVHTAKTTYANFATCDYTEVNINSGTVRTVYGGGENGQVGLDTKVTIGSASSNGTTYMPTVLRSIYGGGKGMWNSSTDYQWDTISGRVKGSTHVILHSGAVSTAYTNSNPEYSVYGGCRNSNVWGNTLVEVGTGDQNSPITGDYLTINGLVFGANNLSGSPYGNTEVHIYRTAHTEANPVNHNDITVVEGNKYPFGLKHVHNDGESTTVDDELTDDDIADLEAAGKNSLSTDNRFAIKAVYGGGNNASHTPKNADGTVNTEGKAQVHVHYCEENTIKEVYGGGNAADCQNTHVIIDGGRIGSIYGGGNGVGTQANITGTAKSDIHGGFYDNVFGGSNTNGTIGTIELNIDNNSGCEELLVNAFGEGNDATGRGGTVTIGCGAKGDVFYGGANNADIVGDIVLNIEGGRFNYVFGGSKGTSSKAANIDGNVTVNYYGGNIGSIFGGSDVNGNITGVITVNVDVDPDYVCNDGMNLNYVYGSGRNASYNPVLSNLPQEGADRISPMVNIKRGKVNKHVYGGGLGATATIGSGNQSISPKVIVGGFTWTDDEDKKHVKPVFIGGNVYGGGDGAQVFGNPKVIIR